MKIAYWITAGGWPSTSRPLKRDSPTPTRGRGSRPVSRPARVMQARDRGIADLVTMGVAAAPKIEALRARAFDGLVRLVERARAAGVLRADFTTEDVVVLMMANAGLLERSSDISQAASRPLVHQLLDGFRASTASEGPPAPSARDTSVRCDATANVASDHPRPSRSNSRCQQTS